MYDDVVLKSPATGSMSAAQGAFAASQLTGVYAASNFAPGIMAYASDSGPLWNNGTNWLAPGQYTGATALSRFIWPPAQLSTLAAYVNGSASFNYVPIDQNVIGTRLDALFYMSAASTTTTNTAAIALSAYAGIYTNVGGTMLSALSTGSTQTTYSYASSNSGVTQLLIGYVRPISVPINFTIAPGEYYVGFNVATSASSIGAATTALNFTLSAIGGVGIETGTNYAEVSAATATNLNLYGAMGLWSATSSGLAASYNLTGMNMTGANLLKANIAVVFRNY